MSDKPANRLHRFFVRVFAGFYLQMSVKAHRRDRSVAKDAIKLKGEVFFSSHKKAVTLAGATAY